MTENDQAWHEKAPSKAFLTLINPRILLKVVFCIRRRESTVVIWRMWWEHIALSTHGKAPGQMSKCNTTYLQLPGKLQSQWKRVSSLAHWQANNSAQVTCQANANNIHQRTKWRTTLPPYMSKTCHTHVKHMSNTCHALTILPDCLDHHFPVVHWSARLFCLTASTTTSL